MTVTGKPVTTLPEAGSVTNSDYILVFSNGTLMRAAGTLFRGDPGQDATINGENVLTIVAGDNIDLSQSDGTLTIASTLRGVYQVKGSATLATLPALTAANEGFVYDMSEAFTTTSGFKEGAGKAYPAGTNVVVASVGNDAYKYDVLSGFVDLSGYVQITRQINGHALSADVTLVKSDIGLGNADNTSDANKPVSTAQQAALDAKQNKLSATGAANKGVYVSAAGVVSAMTYELNKDVPSNAVFTDTTYSPATTSANGLMSAADKAKLDGIASGATANAAATFAPLMDATTAAVGTSTDYARADHVHPIPSDLAAIKALLQNAVLYRTASGNPVTFSDGYPEIFQKLSVTLAPSQSGSGAPAPSNIRPISGGVSSVTVTRTGTGGANSQSVTVSFVDSNNSPLTVCGGTLDALSGTLTVTHTLATFTSGSAWSVGSAGTDKQYYTASIPSAGDNDAVSALLCSHLNAASIWAGNTSYGIGYYNAAAFARQLTLFPTLADFQNWIDAQNSAGTPLQLYYKLKNPVTYQLSPAQIAALSGYNSVSADAGTLEIEYRADTSIILGG